MLARLGSDKGRGLSRWKLAATLLLVVVPMISWSAQRTVIATITKVYSYSQLGTGDILIKVATPPAECSQGFWLSPSDPGHKMTYALLLSAYHTQSMVQLTGEDTSLWSHSGNPYCRLTFAGLE